MKSQIIKLCVFVYCSTLLIHLPASVLASWIPEGNGVTVNGASGTLWSGQAKKIEVNPTMSFTNVKWDVDLLSLLELSAAANVSFNNGDNAMSGKGLVKYGFSGVSATNVIVDISSKELSAFLPPQLPAKIKGNFSFSIKELKQGKPYCAQLDGLIDWKDAFLYSQIGDIKLTTATAILRCDNGAITALVTQRSDQLSTTLDVELGPNGAYQVNGEIQPGEKLPPAIAQSLIFVGPENENGGTSIRLKGTI